MATDFEACEKAMNNLISHLVDSIRARYPLMYVVSFEEQRVLESIRQVATTVSKEVWIWTSTDGLRRDGRKAPVPAARRGPDTTDPRVVLDELANEDQERMVVLLDFHPYLNDPRIIRKLRDLVAALRTRPVSILLVSPVLKLPTELAKEIEVVDHELPDREVLGRALDDLLGWLHERGDVRVDLPRLTREAVIRAAQGLTLGEFENAMAKAVVRARSVDGSAVDSVLEEKKQIIRKSGILEYYDPDATLDQVGGLGQLKDWLRKRGDALSERAREFGLPAPRGVLLVGVQGCGKSLTAKGIAAQWGQPILRLDVGRVFSGTVGSSEENMRLAIRTAESIAPVILWIDEVEKGFAGTGSSNYSDAGTAARVFGTFMTWLQEKRRAVFVVATANDVRQLPPELMRKGRFDEIFFVDLPTASEREAIFRIHLRARDRNPESFDLARLAGASEGFSGAEIEESIVGGLFDAFQAKRPLADDDILHNLDATAPLSRTMDHEVSALRAWARGRARRASAEA